MGNHLREHAHARCSSSIQNVCYAMLLENLQIGRATLPSYIYLIVRQKSMRKRQQYAFKIRKEVPQPCQKQCIVIAVFADKASSFLSSVRIFFLPHS
jgi:hypothetical protein